MLPLRSFFHRLTPLGAGISATGTALMLALSPVALADSPAASPAAAPAASAAPSASPAQTAPVPAAPAAQAPAVDLKSLPFQPSESLVFDVSYLGIPVGSLDLIVGSRTKADGVEVWPVIGAAKTVPAFVFFPVKDRYISLFNPVTKLSVSNELLANENKKVRRERVKFDRAANRATIRKDGGGKASSEKVMDIPPEAQDLLAMLYLIRTKPLKDGDVYESPIFTGHRSFVMKATVMGNETLKLKAGTFNTKRLHIEVAFSGKLGSKREVRIFFTDDAHHMPVRVDAEFFIGTLLADLVSYSLGGQE